MSALLNHSLPSRVFRPGSRHDAFSTRSIHLQASPATGLAATLPHKTHRRPDVSTQALKLIPRDVNLSWSRWELKLLKRAEELDAQLAASGEVTEEDRAEAAQRATPTAQALSAVYFSQYDDPLVHQPMLLDSAYTGAWQAALKQLGPQHIAGKVVLDVGCGPGLLAMLCAKAGARKVIAVDGCARMAELAGKNAEANGMSDVIEVVHADVRDVMLKEKADVVVCSWAGPGLYGGWMLPDVVYARRHLMKAGGVVLPSRATLYGAGLEDREALAAAKERWDAGPAGLDLGAAMAQIIRQPRLDSPMRASQLCTEVAVMAQLDLTTLPQHQASAGLSAAPFSLTCLRDERLWGLLLYFDLGFGAGSSSSSGSSGSGSEAATFTTDPRAPPTHYAQLILNFPRSVKVARGDVLEGSLTFTPTGPLGRDSAIRVDVTFGGVTATAEYVMQHRVVPARVSE